MKKRLVIKIGSSSIIDKDCVNYVRIKELAKSIKRLSDEYDTLIVSSGAIALGKIKLKINLKTMGDKQASAAVGQANLIQTYEDIFSKEGLFVAQILLNHDDFENRKRIINLENTINSLLENHVIPIINENDALSVDEIKVGDNDTLAALVASAVDADKLILCSDIDGLYDKNPNIYADAKFINVIEDVFNLSVDTKGESSSNVGTGGMSTKIMAAKIACSRGCDMIIINSNSINMLDKALSNEIGSLFKAVERLNKYKGWMLFNNKSKGSIIIDLGAKNAILNRKSLLPSGIVDVAGKFLEDSIIDIKYQDSIIAKGLSNFSSEEIKKVIGLKSNDAAIILDSSKHIVHANDIVLVEE